MRPALKIKETTLKFREKLLTVFCRKKLSDIFPSFEKKKIKETTLKFREKLLIVFCRKKLSDIFPSFEKNSINPVLRGERERERDIFASYQYFCNYGNFF